MWDVRIRDDNMQPVAQIDRFSNLTIVQKFNYASTWSLDYYMDAGDVQRGIDELFAVGNGIIARRDGEAVISGPIVSVADYRSAKQWKFTLSGFDDTGWLGRRVALPVVDGSGFSTASHDVRTGAAETIMHEYVDYNAGPNALEERRIPRLVMGTDLGRGETITGKARFKNLLKFLYNLALAGGGLGFRVLQVGDNLEFQVYEPKDKTEDIKFSMSLGNVLSRNFKETMPTANYIYLGGQGEMTERAFVEGGDTTSMDRYGRFEDFKDQRNESEEDNLDDWLAKELEEGKETYSYTANTIETESVKYGDYHLGDLVTAVVGGRTIVNLIREIKFVVKGDSEEIEPVIGSTDLEPDEALVKTFKAVKDLSERVESLEVA